MPSPTHLRIGVLLLSLTVRPPPRQILHLALTPLLNLCIGIAKVHWNPPTPPRPHTHATSAEPTLNAHAQSDQRWTIHPAQEQLKEEAKRQGLWNLWISAGGWWESLDPGRWGAGAGQEGLVAGAVESLDLGRWCVWESPDSGRSVGGVGVWGSR